MPIKLSELLAMATPRSFKYAGETVNIEIFTQKVTPAYRAQWREVMKDPDRDSRCQLVANMLKSWDVLGDDSQPQPLTYEFLQLCPDDFLNLLVEQIEGALFPNPTNASESEKTSPSGSQPTTTQQES